MLRLSTRIPEGSQPRTENDTVADVGMSADLSLALREALSFVVVPGADSVVEGCCCGGGV